MKATVARLKKRIGDCLSGEKGMTLSIETMRNELRELKAVTAADQGDPARFQAFRDILQRYFSTESTVICTEYPWRRFL
jgi:hypothetical protein